MSEHDAKYQKFVEHVDLFHGLDAGDVRKIVSKGMTMRVQKEETIFHKDTIGNQMFVVLGGSIGIFDGPKMLSKLTVGDTFGEMSLLTSQRRSASAVALENSTLFALNEDVFQRLLTKRVAVRMLLNLNRMMAKRLVDSNVKLRESEGR